MNIFKIPLGPWQQTLRSVDLSPELWSLFNIVKQTSYFLFIAISTVYNRQCLF